jgi:hypothetical protein
LTISFPVIGQCLAWKVGNGAYVRIGNDVIGCGERLVFLDDMIFHLQYRGYTTINQVGDPFETSLWSQGWKSAQEIAMDGD